MAKVTSKLQVTLPKALAERFRIAPGDDIDWEPAGDAIRVVKRRRSKNESTAARLRLFDQASIRQQARTAPTSATDRGWTREELYDRDRAG